MNNHHHTDTYYKGSVPVNICLWLVFKTIGIITNITHKKPYTILIRVKNNVYTKTVT